MKTKLLNLLRQIGPVRKIKHQGCGNLYMIHTQGKRGQKAFFQIMVFPK